MEGVKFIDVLRSFEKRVEGENYEWDKKDHDERRVIENDVRRTTFVGVGREECRKTKVLRRILFESLDRIPNKYTQGMSEIGSVFVLYYFEDSVDMELKNGFERGAREDSNVETAHSKEEEGSPQEDEMCPASSDQFIKMPEEERAVFEGFLSKHADKLETLTVVLTNVFRRKFEPLVAGDFAVYKKNIRVFVEMMRKRGIKIPELESHRFMGCIFTFFLRNLSTREDVHKVFEIILSCPDTCPFLLLTVFYNSVSNNEKIRNVDDGLFPKVIKLEEEFIETERRMEGGEGGFSVRNALLLGGAVSVVAAIFVYRMSKKE